MSAPTPAPQPHRNSPPRPANKFQTVREHPMGTREAGEDCSAKCGLQNIADRIGVAGPKPEGIADWIVRQSSDICPGDAEEVAHQLSGTGVVSRNHAGDGKATAYLTEGDVKLVRGWIVGRADRATLREDRIASRQI